MNDYFPPDLSFYAVLTKRVVAIQAMSPFDPTNSTLDSAPLVAVLLERARSTVSDPHWRFHLGRGSATCRTQRWHACRSLAGAPCISSPGGWSGGCQDVWMRWSRLSTSCAALSGFTFRLMYWLRMSPSASPKLVGFLGLPQRTIAACTSNRKNCVALFANP